MTPPVLARLLFPNVSDTQRRRVLASKDAVATFSVKEVETGGGRTDIVILVHERRALRTLAQFLPRSMVRRLDHEKRYLGIPHHWV